MLDCEHFISNVEFRAVNIKLLYGDIADLILAQLYCECANALLKQNKVMMKSPPPPMPGIPDPSDIISYEIKMNLGIPIRFTEQQIEKCQSLITEIFNKARTVLDAVKKSSSFDNYTLYIISKTLNNNGELNGSLDNLIKILSDTIDELEQNYNEINNVSDQVARL